MENIGKKLTNVTVHTFYMIEGRRMTLSCRGQSIRIDNRWLSFKLN